MFDNVPDQATPRNWALRSLTMVLSAFALFGIVFAGAAAALHDPYLIPFLPFLGIGGMACCIGALAVALGEPPSNSSVPAHVKAGAFLAGAFGVALLLWNLGRPSAVGPGAEVILVGVVLASAAVLGIIGLAAMPFLLLLFREEEVVEG